MEDSPEDIANDEVALACALRLFGERVPPQWADFLARGGRIRSGLTIRNTRLRAKEVASTHPKHPVPGPASTSITSGMAEETSSTGQGGVRAQNLR